MRLRVLPAILGDRPPARHLDRPHRARCRRQSKFPVPVCDSRRTRRWQLRSRVTGWGASFVLRPAIGETLRRKVVDRSGRARPSGMRGHSEVALQVLRDARAFPRGFSSMKAVELLSRPCLHHHAPPVRRLRFDHPDVVGHESRGRIPRRHCGRRKEIFRFARARAQRGRFRTRFGPPYSAMRLGSIHPAPRRTVARRRGHGWRGPGLESPKTDSPMGDPNVASGGNKVARVPGSARDAGRIEQPTGSGPAGEKTHTDLAAPSSCVRVVRALLDRPRLE